MSDTNPWHDQDEFWTAMAPFLFTEQHWTDAQGQVERALVLLDVMPGARVLDLCCGPGRHALELARRGLNVTAVDRTAAYLDQARDQAASEGLEIEFVQQDMRDFCRPDTFDGAINLYTSFGYFQDPDEDRRVLVNVHRSLRDNAKLVLEMMGKEVLASIFRERDWHEEDGVILLEDRWISDDWSKANNRWTIIDGTNRQEFTMSHRIYSATELTSLLLECGFASVDVYGSLAGGPYDHTAERLVVVAHKEKGD